MARKYTWDQVKKAVGCSDSDLDKVMKDLKWVDKKNNWTDRAYDQGVDPDDDDYFTADGLKVIKEELGVDDEKEEKSSKKSAKPTAKKGKSDDDEEEGEKPTYAVVKATVKSFDFKSEKQINGIIEILTKKLEELNDEPEEEEEETPRKKKAQKKDDDSDPNEEGRYRGWKITHEGIFAVARKGDDKKLKATLDHGNIRQKIDAEEDK